MTATAAHNGHKLLGIDDILARCQNVQSVGNRQWKANCPIHEADGQQHTPSLSIGESVDGRPLVHCFVCGDNGDPKRFFVSVIHAIGLSNADFNPRPRDDRPNVVASYDYRDTDGTLLYQKLRMEPKSFKQRRPDGNGWIYSLGDVKRVPYRLPELLAADPKLPVIVTEGEKACDAAVKLGYVATCAGGSKGWRKEFSQYFAGRTVYVLPDADIPGVKYAEAVVESLKGSAVVWVVKLPDLLEGQDVFDWILKGGTREALDTLFSQQKVAAAGMVPAFKTVAELRAEFPRMRPHVLDKYARQGETVNIIANPKFGKSWLATGIALHLQAGWPWLGRFDVAKGNVLLIDNELHPETIAHRIPVVANGYGIPASEYENGLCVEHLRGRLTDINAMASYFSQIEKDRFRCIVLDAKYRFMPEGTDENSNADEMRFYNLIDQYSAMTGSTMVLIHHASKGDQSGKRATDIGAGAGSQSRAADCHLVLREHEEQGCAVMEGEVRSFPRPDPVVLRWNYPIWTIADDLDPAAIKRPVGRGEQQQQARDRGGIEIITAALQAEGTMSRRKVRTTTGMRDDRLNRLLNLMRETGLIEVDKEWNVTLVR